MKRPKPDMSWQQFAKRARTGEPMLRAWPNAHAILVSGCQRSGGTMLSEALCEHPAIDDITWSRDAELDAAQMFAGLTPFPTQRSDYVCLQTTYLNERYVDYFERGDGFHLIWLVRNPRSVIYSMLHNWKRFALNEVFAGCGLPHLPDRYRARYERFGRFGVPPAVRASCAYIGKAAQAHELSARLGPRRMTLIEYERLVSDRACVLKQLAAFCGLPEAPDAGHKINQGSMSKAKALSASEVEIVDELCTPAHDGLRALTRDDGSA